MRIGVLSKKYGISSSAVRYYEKLGLITSRRSENNGYREYSDDMARRLQFIKNAQSVGFSLENIKTILNIGAQDDLTCCDSVRELLHHKILEVQKQIHHLKTMKNYLVGIENIWATQINSVDNGLCHLLLELDKSASAHKR
jgi:DNA-binding transcriptional MerR regulator